MRFTNPSKSYALNGDTMKISQSGLDFIKGFESFVPWVYDDKIPPVRGKYREWKGEPVKGTLTIGYGHTNSAKHPLRISQGLRVTEQEACEILDVDLDECERDVNELVKQPLTQGQFDALVSFCFNCGAGNLKKLIAPLNRGLASQTRSNFDLYVKSRGGNGKLEFMRGLQRRRDGEQALWDSEIPQTHTVEDMHHPEDVQGPPEAKKAKDLRSVSRKFVLFAWIKRLAAFLGLGTGTSLTLTEVTAQAKGLSDAFDSLVSNPVLLTVVVASIAVVAVVGALEAMGITDYNEGRWTPSGAE
jgi:lysozyme